MRILHAVALTLLISGSGAGAAEWISREGECGEWRGIWRVEQEQSGLWVGGIDFEQIGGQCKQATGERVSSQVRVAMIGNDFFAVRGGPLMLNYYGTVQDGRARGQITGTGGPNTFRLRVARPDTMQPQRRERPQVDTEEMDDDENSIDQQQTPLDPRDARRDRRR